MHHRSLPAQVAGLVVWMAATLLAGGIGAIASVDAASFYASLNQPAWAPPASVFGPVWTALYVLMGVGAWLVWREPASRERTPALAVFVVQLAVNALWSWLFFAWHQGAWAFADVLLLLVLIAVLIGLFRRVRPLAAALLVPYLVWVGFASALTWAIWHANPGAL
ncbi:TspO/MBR family protein [Hydrogenophaga sp.]|jgi:benzodiazapine receptor|uniref:TspO/MBR family protein n=1 Tax=Hydrogenophaga sp. TaxID=1904254 RepID=UPI003F70C629